MTLRSIFRANMMNYKAKLLIQGLFNRLGLQVRRLESAASLSQAYSEQKRLLGGRVPKTIFEVGAADGRDTSRYAEDYPTARIFAFEPVPESYANLAARAIHCPRIVPIQKAASSHPGTAQFNIGTFEDSSSLYTAQYTGSSFDQYQKPVRTISVGVTTIDDIATEYDVKTIDILKMDAQGAELDILRGAMRLLESDRIGIIYSEVHFMASYAGAPLFDQVASFLRDAGFDLHNLYNLVHNQDARLAWGDAIFVHRSLRQS